LETRPFRKAGFFSSAAGHGVGLLEQGQPGTPSRGETFVETAGAVIAQCGWIFDKSKI